MTSHSGGESPETPDEETWERAIGMVLMMVLDGMDHVQDRDGIVRHVLRQEQIDIVLPVLVQEMALDGPQDVRCLSHITNILARYGHLRDLLPP